MSQPLSTRIAETKLQLTDKIMRYLIKNNLFCTGNYIFQFTIIVAFLSYMQYHLYAVYVLNSITETPSLNLARTKFIRDFSIRQYCWYFTDRLQQKVYDFCLRRVT